MTQNRQSYRLQRRLSGGWRTALTLCAFLACGIAYAQGGGADKATNSIRFASHFDWQNAQLTIRLSQTSADTGRNLPAAGYATEELLNRQLPDYLGRALLPLQVDSLHTVGDLVDSDPRLYRQFSSLLPSVKEGFPIYSADLRTVTLSYTVPLCPAIVSLFVTHARPVPLNRTLKWVPTNKFTGVVIYVAGKLPVHGTDQSADLQPCLFPAIYDENMRTVVDKVRMDPQYLKRWGAVAYTKGFNEKPYIDRIGLSPLRIVATGLFGESPTDMIISDQDANTLLSTENNRTLLAQGRILVIYRNE